MKMNWKLGVYSTAIIAAAYNTVIATCKSLNVKISSTFYDFSRGAKVSKYMLMEHFSFLHDNAMSITWSQSLVYYMIDS